MSEAAASRSPGLGRASALLAAGTLVSRVLGFLKVIVLANTIGQIASDSANAFALANQLPNNVYALIAGGILSAVLVPQIVRASVDAGAGERFINRLLTLGIVAFAALAAIATLAAPALVALYAQSSSGGARGFDPATMHLALLFAWWCLPQIFFYALYSLLGEVLNARQVFGPFTWAPVLNNVVAIAGLVVLSALFAGADPRPASAWSPGLVAVLGGSATLGVACQALVLALFWRRAGLRYRPDFRWRGVGLGRTGRAAGWVFGMVLVTQLAGILQSRVSSLADSGASIAALQNSWLVFMLPHSVVAVSIATAYYTRMSGHATAGRLDAVREDLSASIRSIALVVVFGAAALMAVAFPLARVFESSFDNIAAMALVLVAYLIGLAPFSVQFVLQRAFYALDDTRTPFFVQIVQAALFSAGALACMALPSGLIGPGIALVTTVAGTVQMVVTAALLRRRLGRLDGSRILRGIVQHVLAAIVAGAAGAALVAALGGFSRGGFAVAGIPQALVAIVVAGIVMAAIYGGVLAAMRNPELRGAVGPLVRRVRR